MDRTINESDLSPAQLRDFDEVVLQKDGDATFVPVFRRKVMAGFSDPTVEGRVCGLRRLSVMVPDPDDPVTMSRVRKALGLID